MSNISPLYDESLKVLWDNYSIIETAKEEGREEGRLEGREEGREEGKEEGREESRVEIAREMKKEGLPVAQIARFTGLSVEAVEKLGK